MLLVINQYWAFMYSSQSTFTKITIATTKKEKKNSKNLKNIDATN